ncbi:MAG: hypothetical protein ACLFSQ_06065 [Candidatus Zixiibacteriota bacterium]
MNDDKKSLIGRKMYIPQMSFEASRLMAAAFKSAGLDAEPAPVSNSETLELARKYLLGDECLPESVTLGNFLRIAEREDFEPSKTTFVMPTSNGPCRFGHYLHLAKKIFEERGQGDILFFSPSSYGGYLDDIPDAQSVVRTGMQAIIAADVLRKMLYMNRPRELNKGDADKIYAISIEEIAEAIAEQDISGGRRLKNIVAAMIKMRDRFRNMPKDPEKNPILIGIVGEIYCRFNDFSNNYLIRLIEELGGEAWISDIIEWVWYTNDEDKWRIISSGKRFSGKMLGHKIKSAVMKHDEHKITSPFKQDFKGREEPWPISKVLDLSAPYLPRDGAHGEMVLSIGKALWYRQKGAHGVIDISPFTCMNGIVTEAVYPRVSREHDNFPMKVFYFDGLHEDSRSELEVFMELARNYRNRKNSD